MRWRARPRARSGHADTAIPRRDLGRPRRLLPQHLHRRRRELAHTRDDAVRSTARAPRLSVLRRTGVQSGVLGRTRGGRGPRRAEQRSRARAGSRERRARARALRRHDPDVDVSRRVHRRSARSLRSGRRRRRPAASRERSRSRSPRRVRHGSRRVRAAVLHRLLRDRVPRCQARPRRAPRLRVRRDGEPRVCDVPRIGTPRRPRCSDAGRGRAGRARRSCTRSRTCGSATSSP